jgi:hypothetical protein
MTDSIFAALAAAAAAAEKQGHEVLVIARGGGSVMTFGEPSLLTAKRPFGDLFDVRVVDGKSYSVSGPAALARSSASLAESMRAASAPPCRDAGAFQDLTTQLLLPACEYKYY